MISHFLFILQPLFLQVLLIYRKYREKNFDEWLPVQQRVSGDEGFIDDIDSILTGRRKRQKTGDYSSSVKWKLKIDLFENIPSFHVSFPPHAVVIGNPISKHQCSYEAVNTVLYTTRKQHRFPTINHWQCMGVMASHLNWHSEFFGKMMTSKILFCCLGLATGKWLWQRVEISLNFNWHNQQPNIHLSTFACTF